MIKERDLTFERMSDILINTYNYKRQFMDARYTEREWDKLMLDCVYLEQFQLEEIEDRIARGDAPLPKGRIKFGKDAQRIMEDDWLNEQQKDSFTVRVFWRGPNKESIRLSSEYEDILKKFWDVERQTTEKGAFYYEFDDMPGFRLQELKNEAKRYDYPFVIKEIPQKWARGKLYRARFFRYNQKDVWNRCAYCGRRVIPGGNCLPNEEKMEVDHIIPVAKLANDEVMDNGMSYRELAQVLGIKRADSPLNLVASCHRCNSEKRTRTKGYIRKTMLFTRHSWYWTLRKVLSTVLLIAFIGIVWYFWQFK